MYTVLCFYSEGTPYQELAEKLVASCNHFNLPTHVVPLKNKGSWLANVSQKPFVIQSAMMKLKSNIFYTDVDAVFLKHPGEFAECTKPINAVIVNEKKPPGCWDTGVIYINYGPEALRFINRWCVNQAHNSKKTDLETFDATVRANINDVGRLSPDYFCRSQIDKPGPSTIMFHSQASRKYRGKVAFQ